MKTPRKPSEWQEAVNAAHGALALDSARSYGLVTGGPIVNVARCQQLVSNAKKLGYVPRPEAIEQFIHALARTTKLRGRSAESVRNQRKADESD